MSALRLFAYLTVAAAALTAIASVVTYASQGPLAGLGVAVLLGAPLAFRVRLWGALAAALACFLALLGGPALAEYSRVANGDEAIDAPELLAQRPDVTRIGLHGARLDVAATSTNVHRHGAGKGSTHFEHIVAPIVPGMLQPGEPVHLYAACREASEGRCKDAWATSTTTFVRAKPSELACYQQTLPATQTTPVTFVYHVAPEAYLAELRDQWFAVLWVPVLGWLLIGGLVAGANTLTMRRLAAVE